MNDLQKYTTDLQDILQSLPLEDIERVIEVLEAARAKGRTVFIMGNGGSASTASHFVCDIAKNTRGEGVPLIKAVGLADNMALLSAYANDEGYESVFAQQLANLVHQDDVVIAISTSGESPNVVSAVRLAKEARALTVGFTGQAGGELARLADITVKVPGSRIEHVEDVHLILEHMITSRLREADLSSVSLTVDGHSPFSIGNDEPQSLDASLADALTDDLDMSAFDSQLLRPSKVKMALKRMLSLSLESVRATSGSAVLVGGDKITAATGYLSHDGQTWETKGEDLELVLNAGLAGWVIRNKQPALIPDTDADDRWFKREWEGGVQRSVISVPLVDGSKVLGALTLVNSSEQRFAEDDLVLAMALASGLGVLAAKSIAESADPS